MGFVAPYSRYTHRFENLVARLCEAMLIVNVAELLVLDWKTVNEIDTILAQYVSMVFQDPEAQLFTSNVCS